MKKLIIPIFLLAAFATPPALANAKNFAGFNLGENFNLTQSEFGSNATLTNGATNSTLTFTSSTLGADMGVQAEYNLALGEHFLLGFGTTASFANAAEYDFNVNDTKVSLVLKGTTSIYLAPGYALSDRWLVYGKLASVQARVGAGNDTTFYGTGLGLGARYALTKNWSAHGEVMHHQYDDHKAYYSSYDEVVKFGYNALTVGLSYQF